MRDDEEQDLNPEEREIFRSLASGGALSGAVEDRIVQALQRRGLIRSSVPWFWRRWVQAAGLAAALSAAFLLGTQYGSRERDRTGQTEKQVSAPAPAEVPREPVPEQPAPRGAMLTAFHMDQDHPLASDPWDLGQDPLAITGKPLRP